MKLDNQCIITQTITKYWLLRKITLNEYTLFLYAKGLKLAISQLVDYYPYTVEVNIFDEYSIKERELSIRRINAMIELIEGIDEKTKLMLEKLRIVSTEDGFLMAVITHDKTDEEMQKVIDYIDNSKDVNTSSITLMVMQDDYDQKHREGIQLIKNIYGDLRIIGKEPIDSEEDD